MARKFYTEEEKHMALWEASGMKGYNKSAVLNTRRVTVKKSPLA